MIIALLAVLGVDLVVIIVVLAFVLGRRRWVKRQPGAFAGAIRVTEGELDGLRPKWTRGYGRWVRDVLVWTKAPLLLRNELVAVDGLDAPRPAGAGEVKRLGDSPVLRTLRAGSATVEVATRGDAGDLPAGPHPTAAGTASVDVDVDVARIGRLS